MTTIQQALCSVMEDVGAVGKTGRNQQQNYNFRGIDAVVNAVGPAFRKHGVVVFPQAEDVSYRDVEVGKNATPMRECTVRVRYTFTGPDGDQMDAVVNGEALDSGDKATAKAFSVAYRICLLQVLTIPTDEPDPDESSHERSKRAARPSAEVTGQEPQGSGTAPAPKPQKREHTAEEVAIKAKVQLYRSVCKGKKLDPDVFCKEFLAGGKSLENVDLIEIESLIDAAKDHA